MTKVKNFPLVNKIDNKIYWFTSRGLRKLHKDMKLLGYSITYFYRGLTPEEQDKNPQCSSALCFK